MAKARDVAIRPWDTAMGVERVARRFPDQAGGVVSSWCKDLQKLTSSREYRSVTGMHGDLADGMSALLASISAADQSQGEGTRTGLRQLLELPTSQHRDQQLAYLKTAIDAMEDLLGQRYAEGDPKNVGLLERASKNAELAARTLHGTLATKLQACRIWVITSYMHEVMTRTPKEAKEEAVYIVGRVIFSDPDLLNICSAFVQANDVTDEPVGGKSEEADTTTAKSSAAGELGPTSDLSRASAPTVIEFFLEMLSSVIMLPPLDQDVSCKQIVEVIAAGVSLDDDGQLERLVGGRVVMGKDAPEEAILAMGKYCASRLDVAQMFPTVSALAGPAWEASKERLAVDNFFRSMAGENWMLKHGWAEKDGELCHRYGLAVEDGHVVKICLATNNLQGCIRPDLADCKHLRELVLHGNIITGAIPRRVQRLIASNSEIIVTGFSPLGVTKHEGAAGSSFTARSTDIDETMAVPENECLPEVSSVKYHKKRGSFLKRSLSFLK